MIIMKNDQKQLIGIIESELDYDTHDEYYGFRVLDLYSDTLNKILRAEEQLIHNLKNNPDLDLEIETYTNEVSICYTVPNTETDKESINKLLKTVEELL